MRTLYIHIPYCASKCPYCAFGSIIFDAKEQEAYLQALLKDFERFKDKNFDTLYIGGGTPSLMSAMFYERLFTELSASIKNAKEITIEANPESFNIEKFRLLKDFGVDRVSFGVQSFDEAKLKKLGRIHSAKKAIKAVEDAHKCGINNISLDLIYGVSGDSVDKIRRELDMALSLGVSHISAYSLTLEEGTPFENAKNMSMDSEELGRAIKSMLEAQGFLQYEVSNFGKIRSLHNLNYWMGVEYVGIGAFSVGFFEESRRYAHKTITSYIQNPTYRDIEHLSSDDMRFERIFMGLRSIVGVDLGDIKNTQNLAYLIEEGKISENGGRIYSGDMFLADEMALFLS